MGEDERGAQTAAAEAPELVEESPRAALVRVGVQPHVPQPWTHVARQRGILPRVGAQTGTNVSVKHTHFGREPSSLLKWSSVLLEYGSRQQRTSHVNTQGMLVTLHNLESRGHANTFSIAVFCTRLVFFSRHSMSLGMTCMEGRRM